MIDKGICRSKMIDKFCRVARRRDTANNKSYKPFLFNIISVIFDILPFQFGQSLLLYIFTLKLIIIHFIYFFYFSYI